MYKINLQLFLFFILRRNEYIYILCGFENNYPLGKLLLIAFTINFTIKTEFHSNANFPRLLCFSWIHFQQLDIVMWNPIYMNANAWNKKLCAKPNRAIRFVCWFAFIFIADKFWHEVVGFLLSFVESPEPNLIKIVNISSHQK